jgi:hypothetical protein
MYMSSTPAVIGADTSTLKNAEFNIIQIFWILVGGALLISGIIAWYCISRGGNVAWSTRYGVWVQVACNFK